MFKQRLLTLAVFIFSVSGQNLDIGDPVGVSQLPVPHLRSSYDYIVIGAGSAGAVIAARLSENPAHNVLLLEAGGDGSIITEVPGMVGLTLNTNIDWKYKWVNKHNQKVWNDFKDWNITNVCFTGLSFFSFYYYFIL